MQSEPPFDRREIAAAVLQDYGLEVAGLKFVPVGFSTACYRTDRYFLKVWPPEANDGRSDALLEISLPLMDALAASNLRARIPAPIRTRSGSLRSSYRGMPLAVFPLLAGDHAPEGNDDLPSAVWAEMALVMADIHNATATVSHLGLARETYEAPMLPTLVRALEVAARGGIEAQGLDRIIHPRRDVLECAIARFEEVRAQAAGSTGPEVLCHRDFGGFNILIGPDGRLAVLDWDWPAIAPPEHDLWFAAGPRLGQFLAIYQRAGGITTLRREQFEFAILRRALADLAARVERLLEHDVPAGEAEELLAGIVRWGFDRITNLDASLAALS
jgi:aminoglycoside phosphotransferase (APT) family kinase protein